MENTNKIKELSLGKKIRQIRIDRKITQQELVGDFITRNMLSQIENDVATPSIKTLQYIADHLEVPLSFLMVGEHDDDFNKNYEFDDVETISSKAKQIYFEGDYLKYIEICENNPEIISNIKDNKYQKENAMLLGFACLEAASEFFIGGEKNKCMDYCKKAENCVNNLSEFTQGKQIKRQAELYRFLCQPVLTENGEEYKPSKIVNINNINSDNFIYKTFDENGVCRFKIMAAHRCLQKNDPENALGYLRDVEIFLEDLDNHPYKKDLYKLFEMYYVKVEDYRNAHLYSSKILSLYAGQNKK
ncbi:MAG: helix-turn-helix domain-containing protein [Oscillospiraceae bacterium]|nr:helix-turn-helix domain-containing protein [Oscillospiraceae bacterium]